MWQLTASISPPLGPGLCMLLAESRGRGLLSYESIHFRCLYSALLSPPSFMHDQIYISPEKVKRVSAHIQMCFMQDKIIASHTCFGGHMDVNC